MEWHTLIHRNISWESLEERQQSCLKRVRENPEDAFLLFSEPEPTFTFGISASTNDLKWSKTLAQSRGVSIQSVSRGGKWTYHGPGQIVVYPIFSLEHAGYTRHAVFHFMHNLRRSISEVLESLNVEVIGQDHPFGLYAAERKLASFGVAIHHGITSHGCALYLEDQSDFFSGIHPCGKPNDPTTSLRQLGVFLSWTEICALLEIALKNSFKTPKRC